MKRLSSQYYDYLNVPVGLCFYSLENRKTNQVKFFLYLKSISSGYVIENEPEFLAIASNLGICNKTANSYLKWLVSQGWLIHDPIAKNYRIIGFNSLASKLCFTSSTGAILYKKDITKYKSFAIAAVITYLIERIRVRQWQTKAGLIKRSPNLNSLPSYPFLPHTYLAKALKISKSSAYEYRKMTKGNQFITCLKKYENLDFNSKGLSLMKKHYPERPERLRRKGDQVFTQMPDHINSTIYLRTKANIRTTCQINRMGKKPDLIKENLNHV